MIGLFFGSFDPVHIGHVNVVTAALNSCKVSQVIVIPAFRSVWKDTETPYKYRMIMAKEAFDRISKVIVSNIELGLAEGESLPTYEVIEHFKYTWNDFLIITTPETYKEIPQWQHGEEILNSNKFLVVSSTHFGEVDLLEGDELIYAPDITICSTNLRNKIKNNQIIQPFVQDGVVKIINALELYK